MPSSLSIKRLGLSVSAILAVPYGLVMFASLLLVGEGTNGSWQAALLGITWNTVIGFELGLIGMMVVGFLFALVIVPAYNAIWRRVINKSIASSRPSQARDASTLFWTLRLLIALLVLVPVTLLGLRALAPLLSLGVASDAVDANAQDSGVEIHAVNMGSAINFAFREAEPSFTADGWTMYFNCHNVDICVSHLVGTWKEGIWTTPEIVGAPISTEYEEVEPIINAIGDKLYFTSTRPAQPFMSIPVLSPFINVPRVVNLLATSSGQSFFGGLGLSDVWVSYKVSGVWSQPQNINDIPDEPHINTAYEDHCLFFSADGSEAFWTSTRPGGFGGNDIWTSRRVSGKWTEPENVGTNVNGPGHEHHSIPTPDGRSLYVTTVRDGGYGGEDNYITTRDADRKWGPLANLGSLINGPGDDRCPAWTPDFEMFLFDSTRGAGFGGRDIWWVNFEDVMGYPRDLTFTAAAMPQVSINSVP